MYEHIFDHCCVCVCVTESSVEARLRDLGFGYRARFLQQSAHMIMSDHGPKWLHTLRNTPYLQARDALLTLPGVGPKVAIHLIANVAKAITKCKKGIASRS